VSTPTISGSLGGESIQSLKLQLEHTTVARSICKHPWAINASC
jgi:hypothetical protein